MWILDFLPTWVFHLVLIAGISGLLASKVLTFVPMVSAYKLPLQVISAVLLVAGLYIEGGIANQEKWELRVKEMEAKVAKAEAESAKENTKIVEKVVKQLEVVRVRGDDIIKYVDKELIKYDDQCKIPKEFVKVHNDAAEALK
jgi:hypothetical protein